MGVLPLREARALRVARFVERDWPTMNAEVCQHESRSVVNVYDTRALRSWTFHTYREFEEWERERRTETSDGQAQGG